MVKVKIYILLSIPYIFMSSSCQIKKGGHHFTVMTWNIWHGGLHGPKENNFEEDSTNTDNVLKVIEQHKPDILFMQETYCCGMEIARQAGYPYQLRGSSNLSIHSKYPIIDSLKLFKPFNSHGAIIDVEGQHLVCINVWLHYLPDSFKDMKTLSPDSLILNEGPTRLHEISTILNSIDSLKEIYRIPIIVGGDFNSPSHLDWVETTRAFHYDKVVEWPVSKRMIDAGFVDSFREANPDPTTTMDGTWGYLSSKDIISDRIDYIYYKGKGIKTESSEIIQDDPPGGFFNSDHRAVLSKFYLQSP